MNKELVVRQNSLKDCGVACLVSIMKYYKVDALYEEVAYYLRLNKDGTNAYNIINTARIYGFDGYGVHYTYEDIINNKVILPIICHTIKNNMYHFIVVYKVNKDTIEIMDPSSNISKIKKNDFKSIYNGTSLIIYKVKQIEALSPKTTLNKYILNYLYLVKKDLIVTLFLSLIVVITNLVFNYYFSYLIDSKYNHNLFLMISLIFIIVTFFKNILTFIRERKLYKIEDNIMSHITIDINRKLFNLPYLFFKNKSTGEIESRLDDLSIFRDIISNILVNIVLNTIFVICSFIILLFINKKLLLISIIEIIIYFLITSIFKNTISNNIENISIKESDYKNCLNESISGYETNRNIGLINKVLKKLEIKYINYIKSINKFKSIKNIDNNIKNIVIDILYIVLIFIEISYLNKGIITIGNIILFNTVLLYFKDPLKEIIDYKYNYIYLKNVYKRINDLFVVTTKKEKINISNLKGDILIKDLSYSIDGLHNIFNNINIHIKYKSKYLIYGPSGSGKSTLVKLLLKYLKDYKGNIYIDNVNLKDISTSNIENNFVYVSQNSFINHDTFRNNIICDRDISDNNYEEMINICNLNKLRDLKIQRNDFIIEENGFNISGGERQKIILARSLLKSFNYLILDESLSEVGEKEEIDIINKLFKKYNDKTIIYISHRKSIIDLFNERYRLERSSNE